MKSLVTNLLLFFAIFSSLVFYNYFVAQKKLANKKDSVTQISITSSQASTNLSGPFLVSWYVDAPADFKTNYTTIYYGYSSTPSALTKNDSPSSVGYQFSEPDYKIGNFSLPDNFELNILPPKSGRIWYRAYAKLREDHLWSEEKYIDVLP